MIETSKASSASSEASAEVGESVGLSNPQMSQSRRRMLDLVNGLHSTGVQVDIDLPQIAVVGNQSAGKSSLIESISGITLPRAAGTCTRCPTECRLSHSTAPWKCIVSLRFITDANGQPLGQTRNEAFGPPIYDKKEVEDRIRRAQRAILNPGKPISKFLQDDEDTVGEMEGALTFSMNCISLQISGPDVADLSFCDLPGLIASVGRGGNSSDIRLVESLVTSYIKKSNCIILLTVACETDFENQGAHQLAKLHDPERKRTIGVLTKPDRIPLGEENGWIQFIKNQKEPLENNWYCVKQPSSNDLKQNWSWKQARAKENEFFGATAPWSELEPMYQKYLRTSNLLERLSSVLSDLIAKRLPEIQREIEESIAKTREQIRQLPNEPPRNPFNEVAKLLQEFVADLKIHIEGVPDEEGIMQQIRRPSREFRRRIRETAPKFRPYEKKFAEERTLSRPGFLANEEFDDDADEEFVDDEGCIYVDEVYEFAQNAQTRELPGNFPFVVQQQYIRSISRRWNEPAEALCHTNFEILSEYINKLIHEHFSTMGQGILEHQVRLIMHEHLQNCLEEAKKKVEWLIRIEYDPFTLNKHYLVDYKDKYLVFYRKARKELSSDGGYLSDEYQHQGKLRSTADSGYFIAPSKSVSTLEKEALSGLAKLGFTGLKAEDLAKLLAPDEMEPALNIMADVRAYFQVAYKRIVDNVPMAIDYELVRGADRGLFQLLWQRLGLDGQKAHEICEGYAQESSQIADRREELNKKLERLREATRKLMY